MTKPLQLAGGAFAASHARLTEVHIDWSALDPSQHTDTLVHSAVHVWQDRVRTEYRSVQTMNRLLTDALAAGDPFDVHAGLIDMIGEEVRHVALCAGVVRALGGVPLLPDPVEVKQPDAFTRMPPTQRALSTAISMLIVNETLSVGYIRDLASRCTTPVVADVLRATLDDESEHDDFGEQYVRHALSQFPISTLPQWRQLVQQALAPQRQAAERALADVPQEAKRLDAHPDTELVALGLFGPIRQALVYEQTLSHVLLPRLRRLDLC